MEMGCGIFLGTPNKRESIDKLSEAVNAMLLNGLLKEHRAFLEERCKVERLEKQVAALTAGDERVRDRGEQAGRTNGNELAAIN